MGPRIFTVHEAQSLIPLVEEVFGEIDAVRTRLRRLKSKMEVLEMLWGEEIAGDSCPDRKEYEHYVAEVDRIKGEYEAACKRLLEREIVLKSVDGGLVDFYGVIDGRLVFLCYKRGEGTVGYYHHLEDGFPGRKALPAGGKV